MICGNELWCCLHCNKVLPDKPEPITGQLLEKLLDDFILECRKENPNLATPATYIKTIAIDRLSTAINAHFGAKEAK